MSRILVVAAHPDDELLGCGGTIIKKISEGDEAYALILGEGVTSRYENAEQADPNKMRELHNASKKASDFIGFRKTWILDFPDNRFDSVPLLEIIKSVEKVKKEVDPDIIYTHFERDLNIDHRITFQAVLTACRPLPNDKVRRIFSFETPSSTEWVSPCSGENCFRPNVFVDISKTVDKKIEAIRMYESEARDYPHPRSPESLRIISQKWGISCGMRNAEAFMLIRMLE